MELSSIGLGTYLGTPDSDKDEAYLEAIQAFFIAGGNVFDTAPNYRRGRSELILGRAMEDFPREAVLLSTKVGYLPMGDARRSEREPMEHWFHRVLERPGVVRPEDVVDGCHCLTPGYLMHQTGLSRINLRTDHIDLLHLHNPEHQRIHLGAVEFLDVMRRAFETCETMRLMGWIGAYGCATWNGFRVGPMAPNHLSLEELFELATQVGGKDHGFRWIQAPLNLGMAEAYLMPTQSLGGVQMTLLEAAQALGLRVQTSASILQGRILESIEPELCRKMGVRIPAQAALQFTRSCPGVEVALVGMARHKHVLENAELLDIPKIPPEFISSIFED